MRFLSVLRSSNTSYGSRAGVGSTQQFAYSSSAETPGPSVEGAESLSDDSTDAIRERSPEEMKQRLRDIANKIKLNDKCMVHGDRSHEVGMVGELARRQGHEFHMNLAQHRLDMKRALESRPLNLSLTSAIRLSLGKQQQD